MHSSLQLSWQGVPWQIQGKGQKAMKPITGQYECVHRSVVGLDYFTSRIDRVTLQPTGRFILTVQNQSRLTNAAQSLASGQPITAAAPEMRREGTYVHQDSNITLHFDDGGIEYGQISWNGEGLQLGPNFFDKVSDSTILPPTHRLKKDMDDIAKGLKIASTIGTIAVKAAKTLQGTFQSNQSAQPPAQGTVPPPIQPPPLQPTPSQPGQPLPAAANPPHPAPDVRYCDQCGTPSRSGKRFCNRCGAPLI